MSPEQHPATGDSWHNQAGTTGLQRAGLVLVQWSSPARRENGARAEEAPRRRLEGAPRAVRPACLVVAIAALGAGPAPRQLRAQQETQPSLSLSLSSIHSWEVRGLLSQSEEGLCTPSSGEQATLCKEKARSMPHRRAAPPGRPSLSALTLQVANRSGRPRPTLPTTAP